MLFLDNTTEQFIYLIGFFSVLIFLIWLSLFFYLSFLNGIFKNDDKNGFKK